MRNIEIKARVASLPALAARAQALGAQGPTLIHQDDTFFNCAAGRLNLRAFSPQSGELIFYRRADAAGPKESFYIRSATSQPDALREALTLAYGALGRVTKRRTLYLLGRARIHLDEVEGRGDSSSSKSCSARASPPPPASSKPATSWRGSACRTSSSSPGLSSTS